MKKYNASQLLKKYIDLCLSIEAFPGGELFFNLFACE